MSEQPPDQKRSVSRSLLSKLLPGRGPDRDKMETIELAKNVSIILISLATFVAVWWGLSIVLDTTYLPAPDLVAEAFIESFTKVDLATGRTMWDNIGASLQRVLFGFGLAFITALPLGLLMGFSELSEKFGKPIVEIFRPIPPIAWAPLLVVAMGIFLGPVVVVFIGVFFPLLSNIMFGVKKVDPNLMDAAKTLGAKKTTLFTKVIFPSTVPYMMTGIRIGLGVGWMCIVAAEFIAAKGGGIGYYILLWSQGIGRYENVFAGLIVVAILGLLTTELSGYIEKKVSEWMGMK